MRNKTAILLILSAMHLLLTHTQSVTGQETQTNPRFALVELFTSQGCSSCPPSEEYIGELAAKTDNAVFLAWHVDYWDYLGWKDPFASKEYTERQKQYKAQSGNSNMWTPQWVVNNKVIRNRNDVPGLLKTAKQDEPVPFSIDASFTASDKDIRGTLSIAWTKDADRFEIRVRPVLFAKATETKCKAGENGGKTLREYCTVLQALDPIVDAGTEDLSQEITFELPDDLAPDNLGVAILVERGRANPDNPTHKDKEIHTLQCLSFAVTKEK